MKKNLTKLALSGAALAAVAATLGTSTYAWYTTNPTVNANNIIGASSDTGSSSIYISTDAENWSSTVDLASVSLSTKMVPVSYAGSGTFKKVVPTTGDLGAAGTVGDDVVSFTLYFKSSKVADDNAQSIYIKDFTLANTTGDDLKPADNLLYTKTSGTSHGVDTNKSSYYVDFRNALALAAYNSGDSKDVTCRLDDSSNYTGSAITVPSGRHLVSAGDADGYYDAVMPTALSDAAKAATADYDKSAIAVCPVDGEAYCTVVFYVFLDGGSKFCYDACQGQTFKLNLTFTSKSGEAYTHPTRS